MNSYPCDWCGRECADHGEVTEAGRLCPGTSSSYYSHYTRRLDLDPSPTTPAEEREAWVALVAERDAEIADLRARVAAYDSVRDVLEDRASILADDMAQGMTMRPRERDELDRINAALAATEGK